MDRKTRHQLHEINRVFYQKFAHSFSSTRLDPWPGWSRVCRIAQSTGLAGAGPGSILDVGCGNGRFGRFAAGVWQTPIAYTGIDGSLPLLVQARVALESSPNLGSLLVQADLAEAPTTLPDRPDGYDLIVVFGVLHHLPGFQQRRELISGLCDRLAPGGNLAVTFWQFADRERFQRRVIPWSRFNQQRSQPVRLDQLEPGDFLLPWGGSEGEGQGNPEEGSQRYCHYTAPEEARRLFEGLSLDHRETFVDDGAGRDLNLYHVLERPR